MRRIPYNELCAHPDGAGSAFSAAAGGTSSAEAMLLEAELQAFEFFRADAAEIELRGQELEETHARLDAALNTMPHGLVMLDAEERVVLCNRRLRGLFGFDPDIVRSGATLEQAVAHSCALGNHPGYSVAQAMASMRARMARGVACAFEQALPDGRLLSARWEPMAGGGWVFTYEDITARVAATARAAHLARHDANTDLPNRAALIEAMQSAWARRRGIGFNLLCLEIERFQEICDTSGHAFGDELQRLVAQRIATCVRDCDMVALLRGPRFGVLQLAPADPDLAARLAQRLCEAVRAPLRLHGQTILPACRIGIGIQEIARADPGVDAAGAVQELLRNASLALTCAGQDGAAPILLYTPDMDRRAQARKALESDLRGALAAGQFALHYQPLVSASRRRVTGFEALLRWRHPVRGAVSPAVFVPLAEELGLIDEIGAWVLRSACAEAVRWPEDVGVAVNLSPLQFVPGRGPALDRVVADALARSGLAPRRLELEITESLRLMDDAPTKNMLHRLRGLGAAIALDDFGTGYSSLSYLRSFPFDKLKIDQSFVRGLPDAESRAIVRAISALGASLGIATVAEGVETPTQLAALVGEGCDILQGYLFGRPCPSPEVPCALASALTPFPG
jgi:diguanylate cyclase (GGDEF)-like protein